MKTAVRSTFRIWFSALALMLVTSMAHSFTIDTSSTSTSPMTGLWNNANESGWGAAVTQQYGTMFVTMYVYDGSGNPVWYVASNCVVAAGRCTGRLYKVTGGQAPTVPWTDLNKSVTDVGTLTLAFTDLNTGTLDYTINGASGSKFVTRSIFALAPAATEIQSVTILSDNGTVSPAYAAQMTFTIDARTIQYSVMQTQSGLVSEAWNKPVEAADYAAVQKVIVNNGYLQSQTAVAPTCGIGGPAYTISISKDNNVQSLPFACIGTWPAGVGDLLKLESTLIEKYRGS